MTDLRVQYKVKKTSRKEPNSAEITITNLSQQTRAAMKAKGARVVLQAGYVGTVSQIFAGDARVITHVHEHDKGDWSTILRCGDGERAYLFGQISKSYGANTPVRTVLNDVVAALGIDPGNSRDVTISESFLNGYVAHGRAATELERLLKGRGFAWSVQDGRLQILGQTATTSTITVLSAKSGLVGSPEFGTPDKKGGPSYLKIKSLLQPQIRPGGKIKLDSISVKGTFRAVTVEHEGDTAGGNWYTTVDALPVTT